MKQIWWKEAVAYQIYPRSFFDYNNDGIGDLKGITSKLDYLKDLGIDVIWICPMYKSPNDDNGYDISDYKDIMTDFGTMEDFNELLSEVHKKGMKLIIDLVINHTSDEHEWFIESKSSRDNPKRDWYIWRKGKGELEPNNWESIFKGSAWEYDKDTNEYFLHLFTKKQPDLNWENENLRKEIYKMINWWLDKGIDGFRIDAISHIKKDTEFNDMPNIENQKYLSCFEKHMNVEGIHDFLDELTENTFSKYDVMTVAEANGVSAEEAEEWVGEETGKFNMVFQFEHLDLWNNEDNQAFNVNECKEVLTRWQEGLYNKGWNALFIENHDIPRVVSTWGNDKEYWRESSTALGLMYFMQQGTPFIYQGQEIGMTNVKYESVDEYNDVKSINAYNDMLENSFTEEQCIKHLWAVSRDNARTPMQWSNSINAGFSNSKPWIGINLNYKYINVEDQINDKESILNFYKDMIRIRKNNPILIYGEYKLILENHDKIYAYIREINEEKFIIITNLSENKAQYKNENEILKYENLLISNYEVLPHDDLKYLDLKPYEARMYKID
ncbi:alpha-glucosidase [Clostridium sp. CTA-7]